MHTLYNLTDFSDVNVSAATRARKPRLWVWLISERRILHDEDSNYVSRGGSTEAPCIAIVLDTVVLLFGCLSRLQQLWTYPELGILPGGYDEPA